MLELVTLEQTEKWDAIVRSFDNYDVYWLNGYARAFYLHGDGEPLLLSYQSGSTRGITVVMRRDVAADNRFSEIIPRDCFFDLSTPYGYGGWLIEGEETDKLFSAYSTWQEESHIVSEFVRFHPLVRNHDLCRCFYDLVELGEVVHMDLSSPEIIWSNLTSKNRNMIRKAKKNGIRIYHGCCPEVYEGFRKIYNQTMDRDEASDYYYFEDAFYESLLDDLPQNAQVFYAMKDGVMVAASIMLSANGRMNYHLSGSLKEYMSFAPTNLLLYEAALWGYNNGCRVLYLGGGVGSGDDGLFKFKRSFYKGDLNKFYIGKRICNREAYDSLTLLRGDMISNSGFFPLYRS